MEGATLDLAMLHLVGIGVEDEALRITGEDAVLERDLTTTTYTSCVLVSIALEVVVDVGDTGRCTDDRDVGQCGVCLRYEREGLVLSLSIVV